MATASITVCFREILRDVCQRFSLPAPVYGVPLQDEDGLFTVGVDIEYVGDGTVVETVRCWGQPSVKVEQSEEDAARWAVGKLRDELNFEVLDFNSDDKKFYENLYKRLSADHNILRSYYVEVLAEKERYVAERRKLKQVVDR